MDRDRLDRQQAMLALLGDERDLHALAPKLTAPWLCREAGAWSSRAATEARIAALIASINRGLSAERRARAVKHMQEHAEEFCRLGGLTPHHRGEGLKSQYSHGFPRGCLEGSPSARVSKALP